MSNAAIVATADGRVCGVHSWTEGFRALSPPRKRRPSEDDILASALWLEKHGRGDEALAYIERFVDLPRIQ